jgi:hypothetical protein
VLYHGLILVGAYLLVVGYIDGLRWYEAAGGVLVALGIVVQGAVLAWLAKLSRKASIESPEPGAGVGGPSRWLCVRCGRKAGTPTFACPECGGPMVKGV